MNPMVRPKLRARVNYEVVKAPICADQLLAECPWIPLAVRRTRRGRTARLAAPPPSRVLRRASRATSTACQPAACPDAAVRSVIRDSSHQWIWTITEEDAAPHRQRLRWQALCPGGPVRRTRDTPESPDVAPLRRTRCVAKRHEDTRLLDERLYSTKLVENLELMAGQTESKTQLSKIYSWKSY